MTLPARVVSGEVSPEIFREALTRLASGVTIVTTRDEVGSWHGFTASSFTSLSLDPPLVLVCLARGAESHPVFISCPAFIVNVLRPGHEGLAERFASRGADKFSGEEFRPGTRDGLPVLDDALVNLRCKLDHVHAGGDHTILIGEVEYAHVRGGSPMLHYDRRFWDLVSRNVRSTT